MMGVVRLRDEVGDRQLDLARLGAQRLVVRDEPEPRREERQDVRRLRHDRAVDLHERRRERQRAALLAIEEAHHRRDTALPPRAVDVLRARLFE